MSPAPAPGLAALALSEESACEVHDVWAWNLDEEFAALIALASAAAADCQAGGEGGSVILAFDVEFPGFLRQEPRSGARAVRYQVLRENVDRLRPIQLGVAVAGHDGAPRGVWSFNLRFNVDVDLHSAKSVAFLRRAGIDFPRHAAEGIDAAALGQLLAGSELVGWHARAPCWVTFSGFYDFGYLLRMLTSDKLPQNFGGFDVTLSMFCPRRHELRDELPHGSLDILAHKHGLHRRGRAHTAGSDALLTLELFLLVASSKCVGMQQQLPEQQNSDSWWGGTNELEETQKSRGSWWGVTGGGGMEDVWDTQNMWYQSQQTQPTVVSWGQTWEGGERWHSSWEFQAHHLLAAAAASPMVPLLPR